MNWCSPAFFAYVVSNVNKGDDHELPRRKTPVIPEGLHPVAAFRFKHEFTQAELSSLLKFDRSILAAIEEGSEPTEEQRKRIRIITGIVL